MHVENANKFEFYFKSNYSLRLDFKKILYRKFFWVWAPKGLKKEKTLFDILKHALLQNCNLLNFNRTKNSTKCLYQCNYFC